VGDDLDGLIEGIIVDAYGEDEQLWSFRQAFEEDGRFPFPATVVGAALDGPSQCCWNGAAKGTIFAHG